MESLVEIADRIDRTTRRLRDAETGSNNSFGRFPRSYESFMEQLEGSEFDVEVEKYFDVDPASERSVFSLERWISGPRYDNFPYETLDSWSREGLNGDAAIEFIENSLEEEFTGGKDILEDIFPGYREEDGDIYMDTTLGGTQGYSVRMNRRD